MFSNFRNVRHLVYWKCLIWEKFDLTIIKSVCESFWFTINRPSKILFSNFRLFHFWNFKWLLSKTNLFFNGLRGFLWSSATSQIHLICIFLTVKRQPFEKFLKFPRKCILFLFFSKWKKHYNLTFDNTFKMHYANLNLSSINKPYLRAVEYAISFFSIFYLCLF